MAPVRPPAARWLHWHWVTDHASMNALREPWTRLVRGEQETLGPDFVSAWFATRGHETTPAICVGQNTQGEIAGLLPLARSHHGALVLAGAEAGGAHGDVLLGEGFGEEAARSLLQALRASSWGSIEFVGLAREGVLATTLRDESDGHPVHVHDSAAAPRVLRVQSWDDFLAKRRKRVRHELRRRLRRWEENAAHSVVHTCDEHEVAARMALLFDLHGRRFASRDLETAFGGAELRALHTRFAQALAREGRLVLSVLRSGDRPCAVAYGWRRAGMTTLFQMGIDPETVAEGPGYVLAALIVRDLVAETGGAVDLGTGCYPWKLRWSDSVPKLQDITLYRDGATGSAAKTLRGVVQGLRGVAGRHLHGRSCQGHPRGVALSARSCFRGGCEDCPDPGA